MASLEAQRDTLIVVAIIQSRTPAANRPKLVAQGLQQAAKQMQSLQNPQTVDRSLLYLDRVSSAAYFEATQLLMCWHYSSNFDPTFACCIFGSTAASLPAALAVAGDQGSFPCLAVGGWTIKL
jgi:hypothetical protein